MRSGMKPKGWLSAALVPILALSLAFMPACNPNWIGTALADLPVILQIIVQITTIVAAAKGTTVDPNLAAEVQQDATAAQTHFTNADNLYTTYQQATAAQKPALVGQINSELAAGEQQLQAILVAFHVSDSNLQAAVSIAISSALTTAMLIQSLIPPPSAAIAAGRVYAPERPPSPGELKGAVNSGFARYGYAQYQLR
jgi:hypothetical protein